MSNTFEEEATRYELVQSLKAKVKGMEDHVKDKKYNEKQKALFVDAISNYRQEIAEKSRFTLREAITELGFCYDTGTKIKHLIASHISKPDERDYKKLNTIYHDWFMSVTFVMLGCDDIYDHYVSIFLNSGVNRLSQTRSPEKLADYLSGKGTVRAVHDLKDIDMKLDKLEEIIFRLEEKENVRIRQAIAKQERDASIKYEMKYDENSRELTLNGIFLARPDFMSENDEFLRVIFIEGNSWRHVPISELLEHMKVEELSKKIHQILNDLGIVGVIKEIFIPNVSKNGFEFRNPISYGFAEENKLPTIDLKTIRSSKK
jgi:hypothetical protein